MSYHIAPPYRHSTIPIELIEFSHCNKFEKALRVFIYLKSKCDGIINKKDLDYEDIKNTIGIHTKRTFVKEVNKLLELNWVGFDKVSQNFYIRGYKSIRLAYGFSKRSGVVFDHEEFLTFKSFISSAIINQDIKRQAFAFKKCFIKNMGIAALKKGGAEQAINRVYLKFPPYWGKSNAGLAKLLNCKKSQANRLKMQGEKNGYISTKKHYKVIAELPNYDKAIRNYYNEPYKIRFRKIERKGERIIQVVKQLHDEIIPNLRFKRIGGI